MQAVRTLAKGQVVIPIGIREKLGIKPGRELEIRVLDDHIELYPLPEDPVAALCGFMLGKERAGYDAAADKRLLDALEADGSPSGTSNDTSTGA